MQQIFYISKYEIKIRRKCPMKSIIQFSYRIYLSRSLIMKFMTATLMRHSYVETFSYSFFVAFRSGTDFLSLLILFLSFFLLLGWPRHFKSDGMKFGRIVPQVNRHWLTEWNLLIWHHTFMMLPCWPSHHFMQQSAATKWAKTKHLPAHNGAAFHQFLIYSTFVHVQSFFYC